MKTLEYRNIDKSEWVRGQWDHEPDKKQWQDEQTGLPCLIVRHGRSGHLCGYVGVPAGHIAHGAQYDNVYDSFPELDVHGGLTFSKGCHADADKSKGVCHIPGEGEPDDVWWLGFDCAHSGDLSSISSPRIYGSYGDPCDVYRTFGFVERECAGLARQLSEAQEVTP